MSKMTIHVYKTPGIERTLRPLMPGFPVSTWLKEHAKSFAEMYLRAGRAGRMGYVVPLGSGEGELELSVEQKAGEIYVGFNRIS